MENSVDLIRLLLRSSLILVHTVLLASLFHYMELLKYTVAYIGKYLNYNLERFSLKDGDFDWWINHSGDCEFYQ